MLEVTGFAFALCVLFGLSFLMIRRLTNQRLRMVTNWMDIVIEALLVVQVILGLWIALGYRWGSSWFAADLSPYLWSVLLLDPQIAAVSAMPWVIQLHIALAFVIILLVPFTRLVHFLVAPLPLHRAPLSARDVGLGSQTGARRRQRLDSDETEEQLRPAVPPCRISPLVTRRAGASSDYIRKPHSKA